MALDVKFLLLFGLLHFLLFLLLALDEMLNVLHVAGGLRFLQYIH